MDGEFDAVVLAVGTRGAPKPPDLPGLSPVERSHLYPDGVKVVRGSNGEKFKGEVVHSSRFWEVRYLEGKTVLVIGNNASGVAAVETALARGAKRCVMVTRDDKVGPPCNVLHMPVGSALLIWAPFSGSSGGTY